MTRTALTEVALGRAIAGSLVLLVLACGKEGTTTSPPDQNPIPTITAVSPAQAFSGQTGFTLTVEGTNFISSSVVRWNGSDRSTTYVDGGTLQAAVPAGDVATAGTGSITVFNPAPGGGVSGSVDVSIVNPAPSLATLSPDTAITGQDGFSLTVQGTDFITASVVRWNGSDRPTTYLARRTLQAVIPAGDVATAGSASITVFSPTPGGGLSDSLVLPIVTVAPSLTAVSRDVAMAGQPAFTLTVTGAYFTMSSVLRWNGSDRATTYVNGGVLQAVILESDVVTADTGTITVFTPPPGGGVSTDFTFPVLPESAFEIVFHAWRDADGDGEIYVMTADGTGQVRLTNSPGWDIWPVWSPDGSNLAFNSTRDGDFEIYAMNANGTGLRNLSSNPSADEFPAWSPDGSRLAFTSYRDGNAEIYVVNADGTGLRNLTTSPSAEYTVAWSPGSKIAFTSDRDGNNEIYAINPDGTGLTNLTNSSSGEDDAKWSPDGSQLVFLSDRDGNREVYVMNADGTGLTNVSNSGGDDWRPAWSPDGSAIAFLSNRDGNMEVYVVNADGTGLLRLTASAGTEFSPAWSADGSKIIFEYWPVGGSADIYAMNADGTGRVRLTNAPDGDNGPQWRPTP